MKKDGYDEPYQDIEEEMDVLRKYKYRFYRNKAIQKQRATTNTTYIFSSEFQTLNRLTEKSSKRIFSPTKMNRSKQILFDDAKRTLNAKVNIFNYYRLYCGSDSLFRSSAHKVTVIDKARDDWFY